VRIHTHATHTHTHTHTHAHTRTRTHTTLTFVPNETPFALPFASTSGKSMLNDLGLASPLCLNEWLFMTLPASLEKMARSPPFLDTVHELFLRMI
jgi:hypothetical protein